MSRPLSRICVFCGSNLGRDERFAVAARELGVALVNEGITLVYGGGKVGLMGAIADAALQHGGQVIGVIPHNLARKEVAHDGLTEMHVVESMHQRKALMADLSDGFIAMPGGLGTFEEIFEIVTWGQLGIHHKPSGFLNVAGYYDRLMQFLDHSTQEGLIRMEHRRMILVEGDHLRLLDAMRQYASPIVEKWILPDQR